MKKPVRVRFAPSPTGPLHIGGVRTALYNYLFAKKNNGTFVLRIEDTDQTRFVAGAESYIESSLQWCGLLPDEGVGQGGDFGPYRQSERTEIYKPFVDQLIESGNAYYAFDTPQELDAKRSQAESEGKTWQYDSLTRGSMRNSLNMADADVKELLANDHPYVVRVKIPADEEVRFTDIIRGDISVQTSVLDDKVLFKSDGLPTYHLANVVDDHLMEISHVIRGEEWLPSAPLHVTLYKMLGWADSKPEFAHLPLILKPTGKGKLSKRDGDKLGFPVFPMEWKGEDGMSAGYKESGYEPEAFINLLAFLGWNPGTEKEVYSLEELVQDFSLERVGKSGARFDPEKAKWFNEQHVRSMSSVERVKKLEDIFTQQGRSLSTDQVTKIDQLFIERVTFLKDIPSQAEMLFKAPSSYDEKTVKKRWKPLSPEILNQFKQVVSHVSFERNELEGAFKAMVEQHEYPFGVAMIALRLSLTGLGSGPDLFDIMHFLGAEATIERIDNAIDALSTNEVSQ